MEINPLSILDMSNDDLFLALKNNYYEVLKKHTNSNELSINRREWNTIFFDLIDKFHLQKQFNQNMSKVLVTKYQDLMSKDLDYATCAKYLNNDTRMVSEAMLMTFMEAQLF